MASVGSIGKDRRNPQQGYQFRGIDDIYNALNSALSEHGVFTVPKVLDIKREERPAKSGGILIYTILTVSYTFFASDGSSVEAVTIGEAMDSGDKSSNKCMSAAQKYAFLQVFSIPTEEPKDSENHTYEPQAGNPEPERAPSSGQQAGPAPAGCITSTQAAELEALVKDVGMNTVGFLKTFQAESFERFPVDKFQAACALLAKRKAA
jgi:hypothetical protein